MFSWGKQMHINRALQLYGPPKTRAPNTDKYSIEMLAYYTHEENANW